MFQIFFHIGTTFAFLHIFGYGVPDCKAVLKNIKSGRIVFIKILLFNSQLVFGEKVVTVLVLRTNEH